MFVQIGRCALLKIRTFFRSVRLDSRFGARIGVIATLKGGWGKCGNESLPGGFWALRVEFGDPLFFSNRESRREDRNGGLGSSFRRTDGETREERRFWL